MPLIIPKTLPAYSVLGSENVFVMHKRRARTQHIRPLRIVALNLMPTKIATETQLARLLANSPLQVQLTLLHTASHAASHVPGEHMEAFYKTFDEIRGERFDGMIITGAPVEQMPFEEVDYWPELCQIMDFTRTNVYSTLHVCWGAQAALYHHFGIQKRPSRHTGIDEEQVKACKDLRVLAESDEAGIYLMSTDSGRQIFVTGHPEYERLTLDAEYRRDVAKGLPIAPPRHYYPGDDPSKEPVYRWRAHAFLLYTNWLNYYVYQNTPYDLGELDTF